MTVFKKIKILINNAFLLRVFDEIAYLKLCKE